MWMQVRSLALLSGLRIWHGLELWCRLQMRLGFRVAVAVAVAVAGSDSSDLTLSLGTYIYRWCGPKKAKDKKIKMQFGIHFWPPYCLD